MFWKQQPTLFIIKINYKKKTENMLPLHIVELNK